MTNLDPTLPLEGSEALKAVFRMHASGVAIITSTNSDGEPIGFTASSVTSLGSRPPLASFNISQGSSSYPHLRIGKWVAIHALSDDSIQLAQRFAGLSKDRFVDLDYQTGPGNTPLLNGVSAVLVGKVRERFEVESNAVVVVDAITAEDYQRNKSPLIYFQRGYAAIGERLADNY
ncbi:flavin reductase family protein [Candidatus Aquiluna sp. UB-MaderosW2red]|uniref:flavin reductase family protein n=1 Tax=Candidatus Aquiluna sp. UB-MaderosW2red TaxID=1855377 RepID=UPI000875C1B4|nr:flavin reductase family protein [Candidatus Aquiluna sp. UB-MaderosW2red]SCX12512.1 NADH-FMN oxidoreductase RutF, flavin reductase (DIM6/NTAB) family [Candidatus Aquiluna sp. UB-MaderosW2red]